MDEIIGSLTTTHDVKDLGPVEKCLGINVHRVNGGYYLEQSHLIKELVEKHGLADSRTQPTPISIDHGYFDEAAPSTMTPTELREVEGVLLWLAGTTRPDISLAVNMTARFINKANENHVNGIRRIMKYLANTSDIGLSLVPTHTGTIDAEIYSEADWAGDRTNRRSTSGCIMTINGAAIQWNSKQQVVVALSTMEAEYIASSAGVQECMWISQLLKELQLTTCDTTKLWCDNQSAIRTMDNDLSKSRSKHIDIRYHFIREKVRDKLVEVKYCETGKMKADILTKPLSVAIHSRLKEMIGITKKN